MQLVLAGAVVAQAAVWALKLHNRTWRDVKEAIRKTREYHTKRQHEPR